MADLNLRRLRQNALTRELVREVSVRAEQLIQPVFAVEGISVREEIPGLPGVYRETSDSLLHQVEADIKNGCNKFLLFGVPSQKDELHFSAAFTVSQVERLKQTFGDDLWLAVDVCLCSATSHGHCGVLDESGEHLRNNATVGVLAEFAVAYAQAGADCVAPSDMMDGRVAAIRKELDSQQLERALIMSYSAKFHSHFYGPFRIAAESAPGGKLTDRASYQIDPARPSDALLCARRDAAEGADILMVKPGMPYLDILATLSDEIDLPWAVYQTSGEYAALSLAIQSNLMSPRAIVESWTAFSRAGASIIISYGARQAREWLA